MIPLQYKNSNILGLILFLVRFVTASKKVDELFSTLFYVHNNNWKFETPDTFFLGSGATLIILIAYFITIFVGMYGMH